MPAIWYFVVIIATYFYAQSIRPKANVPKPAALADFDLPVAEQGQARPIAFGEVTVTGPNILGYGALTSQPIKTKGGKK